jgi:hypothetical protein
MKISNVIAGYSDLATLISREKASAGEAVAEERPGTQPLHATAQGGPTAAMVAILSDYDVTDVSPAKFSEMIQELFDVGVISDVELQQLAAIRHDLEMAGLQPDDSLNLLEFYVEKLAELRRRDGDDGLGQTAGGRAEIGPVLRRLDWVEKFALIQSAPDAAGLDTVV